MLKFWKTRERWIVTFSAAILAIGGVLHNSARAEEMQKLQELGVQAPLSAPFTLNVQGLKHTQHSPAMPAGKPYLLHLWATWCGPCRLELPQLMQFMREHPAQPILPVAIDSGDPERVESFLQRLSLHDFPVWVGEQSVIQAALSKLSETGLPMTLLIDGQGRIRAVSDGGIEWQAPQTGSALQTLLREAQ